MSLDDNKNAFRNKRPSSFYSWFRSSVWTDGLNIKIGDYSRHGQVWWLTARVRTEFNPNKSLDRSDVLAVTDWLRDHSDRIILSECDYAVDLPCLTRFISCSSRKDKVTYNDSRYYGKRHHNGRVKVYNKRREILDKCKSDIGSDLSRCEITCKFCESIDFSVCTSFSGSSSSFDSLSSNLQTIALLLSEVSSLGGDVEESLSRCVKDKRNRDKLLPFVLGSDSRAVFDRSLFMQLLHLYRGFFGFDYSFLDYADSKSFGTDCHIVNDKIMFQWGG